jgi:hypothetical protein
LDLNASHVTINNRAVIKRRAEVEAFASRIDYQLFDFDCRHPAHGSCIFAGAPKEHAGNVIPILDAALSGVSWAHAIAAIVVNQTGQQCPGIDSRCFVVGRLFAEFRLHGIE